MRIQSARLLKYFSMSNRFDLSYGLEDLAFRTKQQKLERCIPAEILQK